MKSLIPAVALSLAILATGCAEVPTKAAATQPSPQGLKFTYPTAQRNVVALTAPEREFMLNEMRYYLDMLWVINDALSRDDFDAVAKVARSRIPAMSSSPLPSTLEAKLPSGFLLFWRSTHELVDELALIAEKSRNSRDTLRHAGILLQRCNECHALFQFQTR